MKQILASYHDLLFAKEIPANEYSEEVLEFYSKVIYGKVQYILREIVKCAVVKSECSKHYYGESSSKDNESCEDEFKINYIRSKIRRIMNKNTCLDIF